MQNIAGLPESATIHALGADLVIENHKIESGWNLLRWLKRVIETSKDDWNNLKAEMVYHDVSYEAAMEQCIMELENIHVGPLWIRSWYSSYDTQHGTRGEKLPVLDSLIDHEITDRFTDKIRDCTNWDELYGELHHKSRFSKDMKKQIEEVIKNGTEFSWTTKKNEI